MANHVIRQIRDNAKTALTSLTTTGANVFVNRSDDQALQDNELPALRIKVRESDAVVSSMGVGRVYERTCQLIVEACVKQNATFEDVVYTILKEVEVALAAGVTGAKSVDIAKIEIEDDAKGEKPVALGRFTFHVLFYTANGSPDVAL
jgi:hypothetical protein